MRYFINCKNAIAASKLQIIKQYDVICITDIGTSMVQMGYVYIINELAVFSERTSIVSCVYSIMQKLLSIYYEMEAGYYWLNSIID